MKTLVFCTSYAESDGVWNACWQTWLKAICSSGLDFDQVLIVDDGSPVLPNWDSLTITYEGSEPLPSSSMVLYHHATRLGQDRTADEPFPGWYRSFCYAVNYGIRNGFQKLIHIESDAYLTSNHSIDYFNQIVTGWTSLSCPLHRMPESALQIICVDQFPAAEKFFAEPYHNYVNGNIENSFPFTHVEKGLVGDRYLEFLTYVPSDADYASQVPWSLDRSLFWWLKPDGSMAKRTRPLERRPPDGIVAAYSKVLVFCPEGVSGGHEALHQLRYVLWKQGGRAKLIYGGPNSNIDVHDNCVHCSVGQGFIPIQRFAHYHPQITEEEPIDEQTLIIYPEIMCLSALHSLSTQVRYKKAIWWLSVDNAIATNRELTELSWKDRLFSDPNIVHFYQSEYARKFLEDGGANTIIPLYDYTSVEVANRFVPKKFMFRERKPEGIVSFFPQKGGDLAARFLSYFDVNSLISHRGIPVRFQAIENMSKMEVVNALEDCDIYIDFGINPGKDRVPREAAALGCVVLLREAGAGKFYQDHPLAPEYKFRTEDIENGSLMARIFNLLIDWQWHFEAQAAYRERIQHEEAIFSLQVSEFFFRSNF